MTIRESTEQWEQEYLSPYAAFSRDSRGRDAPEPPCDIRPVYQRDRDRILHCKSFRRLKHKTQVFL
ncbi:MAG: deoxyguanosinetriphosphate triphosphohydrolase, partial [Lachnospiraceae bacterium]|nr:deoxyguanosinetriphosphate triphosphohydrolase [Lachnospiraceae bacterium]